MNSEWEKLCYQLLLSNIYMWAKHVSLTYKQLLSQSELDTSLLSSKLANRHFVNNTGNVMVVKGGNWEKTKVSIKF